MWNAASSISLCPTVLHFMRHLWDQIAVTYGDLIDCCHLQVRNINSQITALWCFQKTRSVSTYITKSWCCSGLWTRHLELRI